MIEQKVERISNEIKSLKASMPVAGSMVNTYFYIKTASRTYNDGTTASYTAKFTPTDIASGLGVTSMYEYCEALASDPGWAQYNPVFLSVDEGYYVSNGAAKLDDSFKATGYGSYEVRVTIAVYSTVEGDIEIEFS